MKSNGLRQSFDLLIGYYQGVINVHKRSKDLFISIEVYEEKLKDYEATLITLMEDYEIIFGGEEE